MWLKNWFEIFQKWFFSQFLIWGDIFIFFQPSGISCTQDSVCKPCMWWWKKNKVFLVQRWHRGVLPRKLQSFPQLDKNVFEAEWIKGCYQLIGPELPAQESVKPSMTNTKWNDRLMNVLTCNHKLPDRLRCRRDKICLWEWLSCCTD